jgi:hypothetical protein
VNLNSRDPLQAGKENPHSGLDLYNLESTYIYVVTRRLGLALPHSKETAGPDQPAS